MTEKNRAPVPPQSDRVYLRVYFDFSKSSVNADNVYFRYSLDDVAYTELGAITDIAFDMPHFTGYRFGLFNYATKETGGYADFDWYRFEEEP
jgi:arabinoxylan arabinofuranohydrolase